MELLNLGLFCLELLLGLLVIPILVVLKLGNLQLKSLDLLDLEGHSYVRLIAFLLLSLKGEAMLAELLTDCAILLQHDLLVLG